MNEQSLLYAGEPGSLPVDLPYPFTKTREDGYPLCPKCKQDDLHSFISSADRFGIHPEMNSSCELPFTPKEYVSAGVTCYSCGWSNHLNGRVATIESNRRVIVTTMPRNFAQNVVHFTRRILRP